VRGEGNTVSSRPGKHKTKVAGTVKYREGNGQWQERESNTYLPISIIDAAFLFEEEIRWSA
jgi:hypothetical protein